MDPFRRHDRGRLPHQDVLTPAEWRVLEHVRQHRTNAEIAVRLGVSVNTVRTHVSSMLAKLEVEDREALARWDGEPAAASQAALARRGMTVASEPVGWVTQAWVRLGPWAKAAGVVGAAGVMAGVIVIAAAASRQPEDEADAPAAVPTTSVVEPEPSATVAAPREWTVGEPIAWPAGLTLVIGTGCYQCGGQYSTFRIVDASGSVQLPKATGEEHTGVESDAPGHLYLARCVNDCDAYTRTPEAPQTVIDESIDGGRTWRTLGQLPELLYIVGRLSDGELVLGLFGRAGVTPYVRFPSGSPLASPAGTNAIPVVLEGELHWIVGSRLLDARGATVRDFASVLPAGARPVQAVLSPNGAMAVPWDREGTFGLTIIQGRAVQTFEGKLRTLHDYVWLDADHLIGSFHYPTDVLAQLGADPLQGASRIPTRVDLRTGTLEPFKDFLRVDTAFTTFGRNTIEAAWP